MRLFPCIFGKTDAQNTLLSCRVQGYMIVRDRPDHACVGDVANLKSRECTFGVTREHERVLRILVTSQKPEAGCGTGAASGLRRVRILAVVVRRQ